ncbi:MAG: transcription antitermination factor NusB [Opitutales bacterium]|nr:transcription antitermination factor NusB [Opitutales bacterium]
METPNENGVPAKQRKVTARHLNRLAAVQFLYAWLSTHAAKTIPNRDELGSELQNFFNPRSPSVDESLETSDPEIHYSPADSFACLGGDVPPENGHARNFYAFAEQLADGVLNNLEMIDEKIKAYLRNWDFDRVEKVAMIILRLAVYELTMRVDIPPIVSINEALDLTKELASPDAKRFVNGVLDQISQTLGRPRR